jgi:DNA-binding ferritin-like protein (Dps family)/uncharacterized membrane protein YidH (DUF202 family)
MMTRTVKRIIAENNEKRELLSTDNKEYYENFLTYMRSAFLKDERATEEVLLEMLDHLLLAQKDGKSAEAVFGKNPKELADDVIENLPTEPFKYVFTFGVELIATLLACYTVVAGIMDIITSQAKTIYLGNALIIVGILLATLAVFIYVVVNYLKKESFKKKKSKAIYVYVPLIFVVASLSPILLLKTLPPIGQEIDLGRYGMFSIGCLLMLITFLMKKIREQR